jgi:hypothetical protein
MVEGTEFNKSLFRFLLNRLAKQEDPFAGAHVLGLLESHPEEPHAILNYLRAAYPMDIIEEALTALLSSSTLVYAYQVYQILNWFREYCTNPSEDLIAAFRKICFDISFPRYVRRTCRAFLALHGTQADLERIVGLYDHTANPSEQVEIICSVCRLEKGRRNAFLGRVENDGEMHHRAVKWVRCQ